MKKFLFLTFVAIALCGCSDSSNDIEITDNTRKPFETWWSGGVRMWKSPHFITEYIIPSKIKAICNVPGNIYVEATGDVYKTFKGGDDKDYDKTLYFSQMYGDTSYSGGVYEGQHSALAYPIEKITMWCSTDFDAEHPAGKPLDDIVTLDFETYYDFIKSGYTAYKDNPEWQNPEEEEFSLTFDNINKDVTKLISVYLAFGSMGNIKFISTPEKAGEYTFTLETTINGEVFKSEFTYTFE